MSQTKSCLLCWILLPPLVSLLVTPISQTALGGGDGAFTLFGGVSHIFLDSPEDFEKKLALSAFTLYDSRSLC
jgi:hypothetical protein